VYFRDVTIAVSLRHTGTQRDIQQVGKTQFDAGGPRSAKETWQWVAKFQK